MSSDTSPLIGFICGSVRKGSINKQLEDALAMRFQRAGAKTTSIHLGSYDLPIYNDDIDAPATVKSLEQKMLSCDGLVITSPEYNGGLPPLLKNAIDWTSKPSKAHFQTAYWGISACTPGPMSGIMCMRQINYILMRLGAHVSPIQVGVGNAAAAFDTKGELIAEPSAGLADKLVKDMLARV